VKIGFTFSFDIKALIEYEAIGMRLRAAVKTCKLTEEEARAKWAAIKKGPDAKEKDDN
jgi:hypothetical protein